MMTKIKSGRAAKLKLLCVLPLAAFLVLVLAEPKVVAKTTDLTPQWQEDTGWQKADTPTKQDKQKQEQQKMTEEKEKKVLEIKKEYQIIQAKIKELEEAYKSADGNDGKKKEIKATLAELYNKEKKIDAWLNGEDNGAVKKVEYVKVSTEEIKNKIEMIKLKLEDTDDPDMKKDLELKLKELTVQLKSAEEGKKDVYATKVTKEKKKEKK